MNKKFFKGSVESRSVSSKKRFVDGKTGLVVSVPRKKLDSSQDKTFNSTQSGEHDCRLAVSCTYIWHVSSFNMYISTCDLSRV